MTLVTIPLILIVLSGLADFTLYITDITFWDGPWNQCFFNGVKLRKYGVKFRGEKKYGVKKTELEIFRKNSKKTEFWIKKYRVRDFLQQKFRNSCSKSNRKYILGYTMFKIFACGALT